MKVLPVALLGLIFAFTILASGCSIDVGIRKAEKLHEVVLAQGEGHDKILLLAIDGIISLEPRGNFFSREPNMVAALREQLDMARGDPKVKAVIVRINSRGGTLGASEMIYDELQRFRKDTGAYVVGLYLEIAASGALYASMASDYIVAYPSAITGSMGVIFISTNFRGLEKKIGIDYRVVKTGERKDMGTPFRDWPPEERKMLDALANGYNREFKEVVFRNRKGHGMSRRDFSILGDARIVSAEQARRIHLVDALGTVDSAIEKVESKIGQGKMKVVAYTRNPGEMRTLYSRPDAMTAFTPGADAEASRATESVMKTLLPLLAGSATDSNLKKGFYYVW